MKNKVGTHADSSWPPPWKPVLQKIPAGLPARDCDAHRSWVASKKALNWLGIIPKREGKPNIKPSASTSCSGLMSATSFVLGGAFIFCNIKSGSVSGTYLQQTQKNYFKVKVLYVNSELLIQGTVHKTNH